MPDLSVEVSDRAKNSYAGRFHPGKQIGSGWGKIELYTRKLCNIQKKIPNKFYTRKLCN